MATGETEKPVLSMHGNDVVEREIFVWADLSQGLSEGS
jgi:hypothetical protein